MIENKKILYFFGRPFSPLYSAAMKMRASLYRKGIFRSHKMAAPVVSVGNLTMGGTGKTPIVAHLAQALTSQGFRPAIISRGYGGRAQGRVNVVSTGTKLLLDAQQAGDEPRLLAELLPAVPVLTGVVRALPCRYAIEQLGCDILILDDGFQHLAVQRDVDLVLFNATTLAGNSRVFPGGDLREAPSALHRASAFLLTGINDATRRRADLFTELLAKRYPAIPTFHCSYQPKSLLTAATGEELPLTQLPSPTHGLCGIAQPQSFHQTLEAAAIQLAGFTGLRDHQPYTGALVTKIEALARKNGARSIITTEKDLVKLHTLPFTLPLYGLHMEARPEEGFSAFLRQALTVS